VSGLIGGTFLDGEPVEQLQSSGVIASGVAAVTLAAATTVPGPPGAPQFNGVAHVQGTFVVGEVIVGQRSGAQCLVTNLQGGLSNANRFRVLFSYLRMRAFFYVGVPPMGLGEFGFAFDNHPYGAFDAAPYNDFFDGFPYQNAQLYRQAYNAVDAVRAAGVGFEVYLEPGPCP